MWASFQKAAETIELQLGTTREGRVKRKWQYSFTKWLTLWARQAFGQISVMLPREGLMTDWFSRIAGVRLMQPEIFRSVLLVVSLLLVPSFAWADWEPTEVVGLVYPRAARSARITGVVVVRLSLDSQGVVTAATILSGHPVLAKAAKENAGRWKFKDSQQSPTSGDPILVYHFSTMRLMTHARTKVARCRTAKSWAATSPARGTVQPSTSARAKFSDHRPLKASCSTAFASRKVAS